MLLDLKHPHINRLAKIAEFGIEHESLARQDCMRRQLRFCAIGKRVSVFSQIESCLLSI